MQTPTIPIRSVADAPVVDRSPTARLTTARLTAAFRHTGRAPAAASETVWVPCVSGVLLLAAGAMSLATRQPWLFPALGPSAVLIAANPGHPTTRFHSVVVGHVTAFACAWLALILLGAGDSATLLGGHAMPVVRVWASAIAVAATTLVQPSFRAWHPPAAATALLVTSGVYHADRSTAFAMLAGVVVVALLGEWFQRLRLAAQSPASPASPAAASTRGH